MAHFPKHFGFTCTRYLLVVATFTVILDLSNMVYAQDPTLTLSGIAPPDQHWVASKPVTQKLKKQLSEEELKDPKKLLEFLKSRPEALDPTKMTPFIAIEVGQTLLYGGELRKAIKLLNMAFKKWPNDVLVLQAWARALIKAGQPSYVRAGIEAWRQSNPQVAVESYTQYLYALSIYLEGPEESQHLDETIALIEKLLANDPNYVGPDGINATRLRTFLGELNQRLSASKR